MPKRRAAAARKVKSAVLAALGLALGFAVVACMGTRMDGWVADPELKLAPGEKAAAVEEPPRSGLVVQYWEWQA
ncbi:MAG: hypothetical protein PVH29_06610 [Candidatus Zixiibacteriota bacterium]|jgi:hypothetical protein